jgi:hypothetical protein
MESRGSKLSIIALLALAPGLAFAQGAAREGALITISFTATVKTAGSFVDGKNARTTSDVNRVLKGRCKLQAADVGPWGIDGPTKAQEKAYLKPDPAMVSMEKEAAKCRGDRACQMALAQKMAEADMQPKAPSGQGAVQVWYPQSCSGSFSANDTYTGDIKDGGFLSYQYRTTITGSATIPEGGEKGWLGLYVEHDVAGKRTQLRFNEAPAQPLEKKTVRTGHQAGTKVERVPVGLTQRASTEPWGPVPGAVPSGSLARRIDGGTLTLEWQVTR